MLRRVTNDKRWPHDQMVRIAEAIASFDPLDPCGACGPPTCVACGDTFVIKEGRELGALCDPCAQTWVDSFARAIHANVCASARYFEVDFGIDYTIIARDKLHVREILKDADGDFEETLAEIGEPDIREFSFADACRRLVWDDGIQTPLVSFPVGSYFSSEF